MKAENERELLTGLRIMKAHLSLLIESMERDREFDSPSNKQFLRGISLDLREIYESYYLRRDKK